MSVASAFAYSGLSKGYGGDLGKFYDVPSYNDFKKGKTPTLKAGYTRSSARMSGEGVGELVYSQNPRRIVISRGMRNNYPKYGMSQGTYIYKTKTKPKPAPKKPASAPVKATPAKSTPTNQYQSQIAALTASIEKQQQENARAQAAAQAAAERRAAAARQAAQKDYQSQLSAMQNLYASNLQSTKDQFGLQISGLQKSMTDQAADFKAQQQTMATNQERARLAGATPELKLQQSADQKIGGTTTFKKRVGTQFNAPTYGSLATIKSGTLNI